MALDRQTQLRRLSDVDQLITNAETTVTKQIRTVDELRREDGHDTSEAEATLKAFQDTLQSLPQLRQQIINTIEQIDKGLA